jgi:hypothetical protein
MIVDKLMLFSVLFLLGLGKCFSQTSSLQIAYDNVGNRITRQIIVSFQKRDTLSSFDTIPSLDTLILAKGDSALSSQNEIENRVKLLNGSVSIFPNPVSNILNVEFSGDDSPEYRFILFDIAGKIHREGQFSDSRASIDISELMVADYFLEIRTRTEKLVWKIIKQQ